jgi:SAM-dependent methyltransferase
MISNRETMNVPLAMQPPLSRTGDTEKIPAHWLLAQMGKRVLRPGGIELTRQMLAALDISSADDVVEFAPGLGATAKLTLQRAPATFIAIEQDEAASRHVGSLLEGPRQRCLVGTAQSTGLASESASVVYGEAMLSMQSATAKERIIAEAVRLLRRGGRYGIHELGLVPDELIETLRDEIARAFSRTIHHLVQPLTIAEWRALLEQHGLEVQATLTAPMHLLEPARLIRDEGLFGAARFAFNVLRHGRVRVRVRHLRQLFRTHHEHVSAVALVAVKG